MAKFCTTKGISAHIDNIIKEADVFITLVTPFIKLSSEYIERLKEAAKKGVLVRLLYGKEERIEEKTFNSLKSIENIKLFYYKNLHAKCYANEKNALITSMNLYDYSEANNREMGVFLSMLQDKSLYEDLMKEISSISIAAEPIDIKIKHKIEIIRHENTSFNIPAKNRNEISKSRMTKRNKAYCIRCNEPIPLCIEKPLCSDCFNTWSFFENREYVENFCHRCGKQIDGITFVKPFCLDCYIIYQRSQPRM
jgi:phosphatidylserine/phosphatidylglycerophosphate/cardiolipin synthase-like enzyme